MSEISDFDLEDDEYGEQNIYDDPNIYVSSVSKKALELPDQQSQSQPQHERRRINEHEGNEFLRKVQKIIKEEQEKRENQSSEKHNRFIFGTDINDEEIMKKFNNFIFKYKKNQHGLSKYVLALRRLKLQNSKSLNIDMKDVEDFDKKLYQQTIAFPQEVIPTMDQVVTFIYKKLNSTDRDDDDDDDNDNNNQREKRKGTTGITVRPFNLLEMKGLRLLNPEDIDKLISIRGMVTRACEIIPDLKIACFRCLQCKTETLVGVNLGKIKEPRKCEQCNSSEIDLFHNECIFKDKQVIKIQETPEAIPEGQTPHSVSVYVFGKLVDNVKPGDRVDVTGVYRVREHRQIFSKRNVMALFESFIDALHFSKTGINSKGSSNLVEITQDNIQNKIVTENLIITEEEIKKFKALSEKDNIFEILKNSLAPSIFGMDYIKKGILCQLFGGTNKDINGMKLRGDLHVLLIGDPGTSKSQMLLHVNKIAPRGIYTSGKGSSSVGLTAYVTKDPNTGQFVLESGALVLSDQGVCCIDEFDKMHEATRSILHEVMEQQTVSIAKAGIVCSLNARTSVLASANPIESKYNDKKSFIYNVNLIPTLLSRFDMIFVVRDDTSNDQKLATHIVSLFEEDEEEEEEGEDDDDMKISDGKEVITMNELTKYIEYAKKTFHPILSDRIQDQLVNCYLEMRKLSVGTRNEIKATPRQLETIIRMSESIAKMHFRNIVESKDVKDAYEIIKQTAYFKSK